MAGRRPGGIILIAVIVWIGAVARIIDGLLVVTHVIRPEGISLASAWVAIAVGAISFFVAFGLFNGSRFARVLVTISLVISLVSSVLSIVARPPDAAGPAIAGILAAIGLLMLYSRSANAYVR